MKKLIILFAIMLSLVGCSNGDDSNNAKVEAEANKIDEITPLEEEDNKIDNVTPLEEEEGPEEQEQASDGDEDYLDPCEICGEDGYSYLDNNNKEHIYCVDHWLEALDNEPKPDNDILIVDLPEEHCAICGDYGEHYFAPSDIWLCDAGWGDWNSYDEA